MSATMRQALTGTTIYHKTRQGMIVLGDSLDYIAECLDDSPTPCAAFLREE
jgi:hypothetical protein